MQRLFFEKCFHDKLLISSNVIFLINNIYEKMEVKL